MMDTAKRKRRNYAVLSKLAYDTQNGKSMKDKLRKYRLGNTMEVVPSLSDRNHTTFYNKKTKRAIVAYRGTDLGNVSDLFTDAAIFFGVERMTPRFSDALSTAERAQKMFGKGNIDVTGHSLGGSEALYVNSKLGTPAHAYNPGKTFQQFDLLSRYDKIRDLACPTCDKTREQNARVYTTGLDPISVNAGRTRAAVQYVPPRGFDVHGIDNFIPPLPVE